VSQVKSILKSYVTLRKQGFKTSEAMEKLRREVGALDEELRRKLLFGIRRYEVKIKELQQQAKSSSVQDESLDASVAQIIANIASQKTPPKPLSPEEIAQQYMEENPETVAVNPFLEIEEVYQITCNKCNTVNWSTSVACRRCGTLLIDPENSTVIAQSSVATTSPSDTSSVNPFQLDERFGLGDILVFYSPLYDQSFELHTKQLLQRELTFGRIDRVSGATPDVNLEEFGGADLGVSRVHMSLAYDPKQQRVYIKDMGSSNGLFVNGDQLRSHEVRVLHSGDQLELGQLVLQVLFDKSNHS